MKTWRDSVKQSDKQDYGEAFELIVMLKEYWLDLIGNYGGIYGIPIIGSSVQYRYKPLYILCRLQTESLPQLPQRSHIPIASVD